MCFDKLEEIIKKSEKGWSSGGSIEDIEVIEWEMEEEKQLE